MWRFLNGLSRGLRTRTPAPPSQTALSKDDNDIPLSSVTFSITSPDHTLNSDGHRENTPSQPRGFEDAHQITQRILGQPSEADILLREFFGPTWKKKKGNDEGSSNSYDCGNIPNNILNGVFGLGTAWITALILGRVALGSWKSQQRRQRESCDISTTWQELEQRYFRPVLTGNSKDGFQLFPAHCHTKRNKFWSSRLNVLPESFSNSTVLAAGGEVNSSNYKTFAVQSKKTQDVHPVENVTKLQPNKKSVTFDYDLTEESAASSQDSASSISEEAIEQFAEDTKGCSGATFDILGLQSVRTGNYKEAFQRFQLGANEGYSKALFNVGLCHERGIGTRKDIAKAIDAYEKAAYKGHAKAQYNLGLILVKKDEIANKVHAIRLLEKAASSGLVQAQSYLGAYFAKPGAFQNRKKAVKMFKLATEQGDSTSKYHLGMCYERGLGGLKQDLLQAFDLYSSAASAGNVDAKYQMAVMLDVGFEGLEKDPKMAHELLTSAAKLGHRPSVELLKGRHQTTRGSVSTLEIKNYPGNSVKVYYNTPSATEGLATQNIPTLTRDKSLLTRGNLSKSDQTLSELHTKDKRDGIPNPLMREILSRRITDSKLMDDLVAPQYKLPSGRAESNFGPQIPHLSQDVVDFLRMPRSSTTPNLCYHSPLVKDPMNAFSLEV